MKYNIQLVIISILFIGGFIYPIRTIYASELGFSTYFGTTSLDILQDLAVDGQGNIYVTGWTMSSTFPTKNAIQNTYAGNRDAFVAKFSSTGSLIYSTYLGGSGLEQGSAIAVDSFGNTYITGKTDSSDFPVLDPIQGSYSGSDDIFLVMLDPDGDLLFSTYYGGNLTTEVSTDIVVDVSGSVYITGFVEGSHFPIVNALQSTSAGFSDVFIVKLDIVNASIVYATYLGGSNSDNGTGIAVDVFGNAYITGTTSSSNFPLVESFQSFVGLDSNAFVTKIASDGSALQFSTYLGGFWKEQGGDITIDNVGNIYITGSTESEDLPVVNALQPLCARKTFSNGSYICSDAFVGRINANTLGLDWLTYLGGNGIENGFGIALNDANDKVYVTGRTDALNFPINDAVQLHYGGGIEDAFVVQLSADGLGIGFSTHLGGNQSDFGNAIAVDHDGDIFISGNTESPNYPIKNALQSSYAGQNDGIIAKIVMHNTLAGIHVSYSEGGVTLTFTQVDISGDTSIISNTVGIQPPTGFRLGNPPTYYRISTTAQFSGNVEICLNYDQIAVQGNESHLKLMHYVSGQGWVNSTTSLDTINNHICGNATSFSNFAVMTEPTIPDLINQVQEFNLQQGIANSLDTKLQRTLEAYSAQTNNNLQEILSALGAFINEVEAQRGNKLTYMQADILSSFAENLMKIMQGLREF